MAVRIMLDGPSRGVGPRLGRVLAVVAGLPLIVAGVAGLYGVMGLGLRLLRGRRRLVLFLRRFGFDDATRAVSFAATKAIGRSWRLVTLDDDRVKAVGGAAGPRRLAGVTTG